ncbi:MAG: hypothetical protein HUJ75_04585, partial [Parasporobacterium sp.]|nr:hypothetical protein [Parasporobacterium sp.]
KKNIFSLLLPALFFAVISIIVRTINDGLTIQSIGILFLQVAKGLVRDSFFAAGLWFLVCLFVVRTLFSLIKKIRSKPVMLIISIVLLAVSEYILTPGTGKSPHLWYNIDIAFYSLGFYVMGYIALPFIQRLFKADSSVKKIIIIITGLIALFFTAGFFFGKPEGAFSPADLNPVLMTIAKLIHAYAGIWFILLISYLVKGFTVLCRIGRDTLYLCGNEYLIKLFVSVLIGIVAPDFELSTPLATALYTVILLVLAHFFLNPVIKKLYKAVSGCFRKLFLPAGHREGNK